MTSLTFRGDRAGVLGVRRFANYRDEPWRRYHYPVRTYQSRVDALAGSIVLLYEPRRGGDAPDSALGGRSAFVGYAILGESSPDPEDPSHGYVDLRHACEFPEPVPLSQVGVSSTVVRSAVARISFAVAERILQAGVAPVLRQPAVVADGLVDLSTPPELAKRKLQDILTTRAVRDRSFRVRVVRDAYRGRCALTGLLLTNGHGRAEADAAHIRPVDRDGPDIVQNGLALAKTVHWAFDRGLVSLTDDGRILRVERGVDDALVRLLPADDRAFLPKNLADQPHPAFLSWHRKNVFEGVA